MVPYQLQVASEPHPCVVESVPTVATQAPLVLDVLGGPGGWQLSAQALVAVLEATWNLGTFCGQGATRDFRLSPAVWQDLWPGLAQHLDGLGGSGASPGAGHSASKSSDEGVAGVTVQLWPTAAPEFTFEWVEAPDYAQEPAVRVVVDGLRVQVLGLAMGTRWPLALWDLRFETVARLPVDGEGRVSLAPEHTVLEGLTVVPATDGLIAAMTDLDTPTAQALAHEVAQQLLTWKPFWRAPVLAGMTATHLTLDEGYLNVHFDGSGAAP